MKQEMKQEKKQSVNVAKFGRRPVVGKMWKRVGKVVCTFFDN
jgi:hypothetical protein